MRMHVMIKRFRYVRWGYSDARSEMKDSPRNLAKIAKHSFIDVRLEGPKATATRMDVALVATTKGQNPSVRIRGIRSQALPKD